jgi:hypothetical protein
MLIAPLWMAPLRSVFVATIAAQYANKKNTDCARVMLRRRLYERLDPANTKICFLDENPKSTRLFVWLFQFEALPYDVEKAVAWRLGGPYYDADYYRSPLTPKNGGGAVGRALRTCTANTSDSLRILCSSFAEAEGHPVGQDTPYPKQRQALLTRVNPS